MRGCIAYPSKKTTHLVVVVVGVRVGVAVIVGVHQAHLLVVVVLLGQVVPVKVTKAVELLCAHDHQKLDEGTSGKSEGEKALPKG